MTTLRSLWKSISRHREDVQKIIGAHLPRGVPLVHIVCAKCGNRVATVEERANGGIVTFWRGRRFPDVPYMECQTHGRLDLDRDKEMLKVKVADARKKGKPGTLRAHTVR